MHEAGLMQSVLDMAADAMRAAGGNELRTIRLRVGALSGAACEALAFAFEALKNGTPAAGARLEMEQVAVRLVCRACGCAFEPLGFHDACPGCGSGTTDVVQGRELELVSVDLAVPGETEASGGD